MKFDCINHVILFGGGDTLVRFALNLLGRGYHVEVVTAERRREDPIPMRGKIVPLEDFLKLQKILFHISKDVNTDKAVIKKITPQTMGFSIAASWIFRKEFIALFRGYLLNHHGAPLPWFRGGGGMSWRILQNYRPGFNLIHQVDEGVDTGPILKMREFVYPDQCRVPQDYFNINIEREEEFLCQFLDDIKNGKDFHLTAQAKDSGSYWPRLSTEHQGYINWNWSLEEIESFICAFDDPYAGASTLINNKRVYLKKCCVDGSDGPFHPFQNGLVYCKRGDALAVALREGSLIVGEVKDAQGRSMMTEIRLGDRFHTPVQYLESAMQFRAFYAADGLKKQKEKAIAS